MGTGSAERYRLEMMYSTRASGSLKDASAFSSWRLRSF